METVIAKSKKTILSIYIAIIVLGVVMCLLGLLFYVFSKETFIVVMFPIFGVLITGIGIGWTVYIARLPKNYITFKDGKLHFYDGAEYSLSEVDYCQARSGGLDGAIFNFGRLIISVRHQEYKLKFVENAQSVAVNINSLKLQQSQIEAVQKHIAERKAAEEKGSENDG